MTAQEPNQFQEPPTPVGMPSPSAMSKAYARAYPEGDEIQSATSLEGDIAAMLRALTTLEAARDRLVRKLDPILTAENNVKHGDEPRELRMASGIAGTVMGATERIGQLAATLYQLIGRVDLEDTDEPF